MRRSLIAGVATALLLLRPAASLVRAQEKPATETQKIEALIKHVEGLKGATFVRNNRDYDAKTAAVFLRGKWKANQAKIKTAKDFVDKVASVSSTTGKPYTIRFTSGKEVKGRDHLLAVLKRLEKPSGEGGSP